MSPASSSARVLLVLLTVFVTRTRLGLSMQAVAEDLPAARLMGIKVNRVVMVAFAIASGLAAVAGYPVRIPGRARSIPTWASRPCSRRSSRR